MMALSVKMLQQCRQESESAIHYNTLLPLVLSKKLATEEEISDDCYWTCEEQRNILDIIIAKGVASAFVSVLKGKDKHLDHECLGKILEKEMEQLSKSPNPQPRGQITVCSPTTYIAMTNNHLVYCYKGGRCTEQQTRK